MVIIFIENPSDPDRSTFMCQDLHRNRLKCILDSSLQLPPGRYHIAMEAPFMSSSNFTLGRHD